MKYFILVLLIMAACCSKPPVIQPNPPLKHWGGDSSAYVGNDTGTIKK